MKRFSILLLLLICILSVGAHNLDVVILGDSNVWLGGDECDNPKGWTYHFAELFSPRTIRSYARSGATWTNHPDTKLNTEEYTEILANDNVIYNQVQRLIEAYKTGTQPMPNLIIVAAGGNDAWFHARRPGIFDAYDLDTDIPTSLAGSVHHNCALLQQAFPDAQIVLMTPHQMTKPDPAMLRKVSEIIAEAGADMGISVIRTDICGPTSRQQELKGFVNTYDGVHTSLQGAKKTARFVTNQLNSILQVDN